MRLVVIQLGGIIAVANIVFGDVHGHLQRILDLIHSVFKGSGTTVWQLMRLASIGINGSAGITQLSDQLNELVRVSLECVIVIIDKDGIRPALVGHLESLDDPVIARHAVTSQRILIGSRGMARNSLVHHVYHLQVSILPPDSIHPFGISLQLVFLRQVVHPLGILRSPRQGVELERESMIFGIFVDTVTVSPVETVTGCTFYLVPFRLVFRSNLVPQRIERLVTIVYLPLSGDIAQELIGVCRQLSLHADSHQDYHYH